MNSSVLVGHSFLRDRLPDEPRSKQVLIVILGGLPSARAARFALKSICLACDLKMQKKIAISAMVITIRETIRFMVLYVEAYLVDKVGFSLLWYSFQRDSLLKGSPMTIILLFSSTRKVLFLANTVCM